MRRSDFPPTTLVSVNGREGRFIVVPTGSRVPDDEINVMASSGTVETVRVDQITKIADAPDIAAEHVWQHPKVDQDLATARNNLRLNVEEMRGFLAQGDPVEKAFIGFAKAIYDQRERYGAAHMAIMIAAAVLTLTQNEDAPARSIYDDPRLADEFTAEPVVGADGIGMALTHVTCGHRDFLPVASLKPSPALLMDMGLLHLRECG